MSTLHFWVNMLINVFICRIKIQIKVLLKNLSLKSLSILVQFSAISGVFPPRQRTHL